MSEGQPLIYRVYSPDTSSYPAPEPRDEAVIAAEQREAAINTWTAAAICGLPELQQKMMGVIKSLEPRE